MKLKYILLILVIIVMIPEVLLISYILGKYSISIQLPQLPANNFISFLLLNPFFIGIIVVIFAAMLVLYFTLKLK